MGKCFTCEEALIACEEKNLSHWLFPNLRIHRLQIGLEASYPCQILNRGSAYLTNVIYKLFDRTDYYHTTFKKLGIHTQSAHEKRERGNRSPRYHEDPALRNALEETLKRQQIRAVFLDEAQHLMKASNGAKPRDQLDWIKSMTNV